MNVEPHPERAIDRALAGKLPPREQQDLDRHLALCLACSAHMALARASRTYRAPQPFDSGLNRLAVGNALASMKQSRWAPALWLRARRRRGAVLAAGILLGLGGVSSAAWWQHNRLSPEDALTASDEASRVAMARPTRSRAPGQVAPVVNAAEIPSAIEEPIASDSRDDRGGGAPYQGARSQRSAAALFDEASGLRAHNKGDQAIAVFRKLQRLYPRARETRLSFALAGRLLLDRGRSAQALSQFDQHLALGGDATEEALAGRATALGRMGRVDAERETWKRLLDAYPRTVYANQARERLTELKGLSSGPGGSRSLVR